MQQTSGTVSLLDEKLIDVPQEHPVFSDDSLMDGWRDVVEKIVSSRVGLAPQLLDQPVEVVPRVYIGTTRHAENEKLLQRLNIRCVLDCSNTRKHQHEQRLEPISPPRSDLGNSSPSLILQSTTTSNSSSPSAVSRSPGGTTSGAEKPLTMAQRALLLDLENGQDRYMSTTEPLLLSESPTKSAVPVSVPIPSPSVSSALFAGQSHYAFLNDLASSSRRLPLMAASKHIDTVLRESQKWEAADRHSPKGKAEGPNHAIMIFCLSGINKSAAICAGYLMRYRKFSLIEALTQLRNLLGHIIQVPEHQRQLIEFAAELDRLDSVKKWKEVEDSDPDRELFQDWDSMSSGQLGPDDADLDSTHESDLARDGTEDLLL